MHAENSGRRSLLRPILAGTRDSDAQRLLHFKNFPSGARADPSVRQRRRLIKTGDAEFRSINRNPYLFGSNPVNSQFRSINNRIIRSCMRARRFSDCMHVRSTAVSEIRTLDMHARARFQRSNSVMHVFTVMHDQLCMMRALFNTSFTRILLALLLATSQTICTVAIEIVRRSKLRVSGLKAQIPRIAAARQQLW